MIICGTGHRPNKLGGYTQDAEAKRHNLAYHWLNIHKPDLVISGMALGWDQALCTAADRLNIPFHAYVPFQGQEKMWPQQSQQQFKRLCLMATEVKICCEGGYAASKMQRRNEMMVDAADQVLALFDGTPGGTWNCIKYAESQGKIITNLWSEWSKP